jgi:hypothetical protein
MLNAIWSSGTWPGPSTIACTPAARARWTELAHHVQLGELRRVGRVGEAARPQSVAERVGDVVLAHDGADLVEQLVHRVLLAVMDHPLGEAASRRARRCR